MTQNRRRKKMLWILAIIVLGLAATYVILAFSNGYRFPDKDKHKDWPMFPATSNTNISIEAIKGMYIGNLQAIPGTTDYMIFYSPDSSSFHDWIHYFAIIDDQGSFILKRDDYSAKVHYNDERIFISGANEKDSCDVYHPLTRQITKQVIKTIDLPKIENNDTTTYYQHNQNDFFRSLKGLRWFEDRAIYPNNDSRSRGLSRYADPAGNIYRLANNDRSSELALLNPALMGYDLETSAYVAGTVAEAIKETTPATLDDNLIRWGYRLAMGNPNGGSGGFYFFVVHTWMHYFAVNVGGKTTNFKVEGPDEKEVYIRFYQLNKPKTPDEPLAIVAQDRIWLLSSK